MKANKTQDLHLHCINISKLAVKILKKINVKQDLKINDFISYKDLEKICFFAALFHDFGKTDYAFQMYLNLKANQDTSNGVHVDLSEEKSFECSPRHNEISFYLLKEMGFNFFKNKNLNKIIQNISLWHHAQPSRKNEINSYKISQYLKKYRKENIKNIQEFLTKVMPYIESSGYSISYDEEVNNIFEPDDYNLSAYKMFYSQKGMMESVDIDSCLEDVNYEAITSLIKTVVISADRLVSSSKEKYTNGNALYSDFLKTFNKTDITKKINIMEKTFFPDSKRSKDQKKAVTKLTDVNRKGNIPVLSGAAGSGKTKIFLQYCARNFAQKIFIIAPRMIICEELFYEIKDKYLPNAKIEIITSNLNEYYNGETKEYGKSNNDEPEIVITTIDQIIKSITTHKNVDKILELAQNFVIFDEYHEYFKMSGFDLLFSELIKINSYFKKSNILLTSATPNNVFLETMLGLKTHGINNSIVKFETFNKKDFKIKYDFYKNDELKSNIGVLYDLRKNNNLDDIIFKELDKETKTIVVSNTATKAQLSYLLNCEDENSLLAHSKFSKNIKESNFKKIKESFGTIEPSKNNILRAGPIVQSSLNITSGRLITEITNPEETLQRLGRLNRFGDDVLGEFIISVPEKTLNPIESIKKSEIYAFLGRKYEKESVHAWINYLMKSIENNSNFKLADFYKVYDAFYKNGDHISIIKNELSKSILQSCKNISRNIFNPTENLLGEKSGRQKKNNLRGESIQVRMSSYMFSNKKVRNMSYYIDDISIAINDLLLNNNNSKHIYDSIQNIKKIDKDTKFPKNMNEKQFMAMAKSGKQSIYVSYTNDDLKIIEKEQDEDSIIYVKTEKEDVGYMKSKKVFLEFDNNEIKDEEKENIDDQENFDDETKED